MTHEVIDWKLLIAVDPPEARRLNDLINSYARKIKKDLAGTTVKKEKREIIYAYYRRFYTLTLSKSYLKVGINKTPTRETINK